MITKNHKEARREKKKKHEAPPSQKNGVLPNI
jgi:hypothetical protein